MSCHCEVTKRETEHVDFVIYGMPCVTAHRWHGALSEELHAQNRISHIHSDVFHPGDGGDLQLFA
jgi:hypothetical protein